MANGYDVMEKAPKLKIKVKYRGKWGLATHIRIEKDGTIDIEYVDCYEGVVDIEHIEAVKVEII